MVEVDVKSIDVQPNECEIDQPLDLKITFVPDGDVANASWEFKVRWRAMARTRLCRAAWALFPG